MAVTDDGSVVLVHQYRPAVDRWVLEVPGRDLRRGRRGHRGHRPAGAGRGGRLRRRPPDPADPVPRSPRASATRCRRCTWPPGSGPSRSTARAIEEGYMRVVEVPVDEFDDLVDDGTIVDATTILGVGLARRRLADRGRMNLPLSDGAEEYLSWLAVEKGRSRNTLLAYRRDIATWEQWAAGGRGRPGRRTRPRPSSATWPSCGPRGATRPRWPGPPRPCGACSGSWSARGSSTGDPTADVRSPTAAPAPAQGPRGGPGHRGSSTR